MEIYDNLVDYNERNYAPISNEKIWQAIRKIMVDEEADARNINLDSHNVTVDTFCRTPVTPNTQGENENIILTSARLNNPDARVETLKGLTIKDSVYYDSDKNDPKGNPGSDQKGSYSH